MAKFANLKSMDRALFSLLLLPFLLGCSGSDAINEGTYETESSPASTSTPSPVASPLFEKYTYAYSSLCNPPEIMYEIRRDADLFDRGLLGPKDLEQNLKILGTDLLQSVEYVGSRWPSTELNPDKELLNDFEILGEQILQDRLKLLNEEPVTMVAVASQVDALFNRGIIFCDWVKENS